MLPNTTTEKNSVSLPLKLFQAVLRIREVYPGFEFFQPGSRDKKIPDSGSGSASKNLGIFNPKNCFSSLGNMIRDDHPESGSWILPIPDPGSRGQKGTGSRIRIRNSWFQVWRYLPVAAANDGSFGQPPDRPHNSIVFHTLILGGGGGGEGFHRFPAALSAPLLSFRLLSLIHELLNIF